MLGALFNAIGIITVSEENDVIKVRGINGYHLDHDISSHWGTSKIYSHIFKKSSGYGFELDSFFAIELLYVLRKIIDDGRKIRGSKRQYDNLAKLLVSNTWLKTTEGTQPSKLNYDGLNRLNIKLFDHQDRFIRTYDDRASRYRLNGYILGAAPGSGKALENSTLVRTPTGWKAIGDMQVGDVVISDKGLPTNVTGVFPQGNIDLYEIVFEDGRSRKCCLEHLWKFTDSSKANTKWKVRNTKSMINLLNKGVDLYIPLVDYTKEAITTDTFKENPYVVCGDIAKFIKNGNDVDSFSKGTAGTLNKYGVSVDNLRIPKEYLNANFTTRCAVYNAFAYKLAKRCNATNTDSIEMDNLDLLKDIQEVCWSIGLIAKLDTVGFKHSLVVQNKNNSFVYGKENKDLNLKVKSIKKSSKGLATCISVDSQDKLFVVQDHIVTHNTIINFALSECIGADTTFIVVPKNSIDRVWRDTIESIFHETPSYWISSSGQPITPGKRYYIAHYEQLEVLLTFAKKNKLGVVNIALDESHNFNDLKSARTQMFCELVKVTKSICTIFASGTPVKALGSEIIPILRSIDRYFKPHVEERFKKVFGLSSSKGLDILCNRMGLITYRVEKANVVGNTVHTYEVDVKMPTGGEYTLDKIRAIMTKFIEERMKYYKDNLKMFYDIYFQGLSFHESTLRDAQSLADYRKYRAYASIINKGYDPKLHVQEALYCNSYEKNKIIPFLPNSLKEPFKNARSVYKYYHLKVQGEALGRILGKMRTQCNIDMVYAMDNYRIRTSKFPLGGNEITLPEIINQGIKKTVIFTSYVEVVEELDKLLKARGFSPVLVYGQTNKNLTQMISDFEKNPDLNPIIATYPSLSTAVPLVMANQCVMLNSPFRVHEYEQATSRVDRIGQTEIVNIFNIFLDTGSDVNISTRSVDIMSWSKAQVDAILGIDTPDYAVESFVSRDGKQNKSLLSVDEIEIVEDIAIESSPPTDHYLIKTVTNEVKKNSLSW